jgi:ATP-dependent DNA ligase
VLPKIEPMKLIQQPSPFYHEKWLFEFKHDGFRALAYLEEGKCNLLNVSWPEAVVRGTSNVRFRP